MRKLLLISVSLLLASISASAQISTPSNCPTITISGPTGLTRPEVPLRIAVVVTPSIENLKYFWRISAGTIAEGQGTSSISIMTTEENNFSDISANVEIEGLFPNCNHTANDKFGVSSGILDMSPVDDFQWKTSRNDERARLDNLAIQLNNSAAKNLAYIVLKTKNSRRIVEQRIKQIKNTLFVRRKYPNKDRYIFLLEISDAEEITFWLAPPEYRPCKETCSEIK